MTKDAIVRICPFEQYINGREEQRMKDKSPLRELVRGMLAAMAVMTAVCWAITLLWGFDLPTLFGFAVGYVYVVVCYFYLARCCEKAVELDVQKGKRVMLTCYLVRFAGLFALSAAAMLTGSLNVIGILVPQFFPRIILTTREFFINKKGSD